MSDAVKIATRYTPEDAEETDRYPRTNGPGEIVVYQSDWLAQRFADLQYGWVASKKNGEIGDLSLWYWVPGKDIYGQELVERIFVTTGKNAYDNYGD
jgi:hypothetical protein